MLATGDKPKVIMRLLLLTRYDYEGASSRYRMLQFVPYLENNGIECTINPLFRKGYLANRYSSHKRLTNTIIMDYWRRFKRLIHSTQFDLIFLEKEAIPYLPAFIEFRLLLRGLPYVCDLDDAWFHLYDSHSNPLIRHFLGAKIGSLLCGARAVTVGSQYLLEYARKYNSVTDLIPTGVNIDLYPRVAPECKNEVFTIGWIGSQSTVAHLKTIEDALDKYCRMYNARVVVIGGAAGSLKISNLVHIPWTEETEVQELSKIDVGIMPLPNTPWARGKCAFKLIQYMACWKPSVASPVGENTILIDSEKYGFLADSTDEWIRALTRLRENPALRRSIGESGRSKVEKYFTLQTVAPRLEAVLREAYHTKC